MQSKLLMKLFIGSEAVFFISLIMAYLFFRQSGNFEYFARYSLNIQMTGLFSLCLAGSSFTFMMAEKSYKKNNRAGMKMWLLITILLGIIFLAGQAKEYFNLVQKNITISETEFGSSFYALTGFHIFHVLIGLIVLAILLFLTLRGYFDSQSSPAITAAGIYWHFVDVVWVIIFSIIYALPYLS